MVVDYNKELNQELLDRQAVASELARQLAYHRKIIDDKERLREVCKDLVWLNIGRFFFLACLKLNVGCFVILFYPVRLILITSPETCTIKMKGRMDIKHYCSIFLQKCVLFSVEIIC